MSNATQTYCSKPKAYSDEIIAEIRAASDGVEVANILEDWIAEAFEGSCDNCRDNAAHLLAMHLLPLVRPDLFIGHGKNFPTANGEFA